MQVGDLYATGWHAVRAVQDRTVTATLAGCRCMRAHVACAVHVAYRPCGVACGRAAWQGRRRRCCGRPTRPRRELRNVPCRVTEAMQGCVGGLQGRVGGLQGRVN
eukprot:57179-Chlamydomonas_euryale.AAC.1